MLILDAHLDLAMNALEWNRDLTRPIDEIRAREQALTDKPDRGRGTVSFPEMRRGGIGVCVATQIARYVAPDNPLSGWHSPDQAWAHTQGQLAWYRRMEERGELVQIRDREELDAQVSRFENGDTSDASDWIHPESGGRRLDRHAGAPRTGVRAGAAGPRPGALRPRGLRAGHERLRRHGGEGPCAPARHGAAGHHPRRDAPLRRQSS